MRWNYIFAFHHNVIRRISNTSGLQMWSLTLTGKGTTCNQILQFFDSYQSSHIKVFPQNSGENMMWVKQTTSNNVKAWNQLFFLTPGSYLRVHLFPKTTPTCLNCGHFTPAPAVDNSNTIQYSKDGGYRGSPDSDAQCSLNSVLRCTSDLAKMWTSLRMTRKNNSLSDTKMHKMFLNTIAWDQIWFHEILESEQHETERERDKYCFFLSS